MLKTITVQTLHDHLAKVDSRKEIVIDVRTSPEHAAGHIPGAVHRELDEIERHVSELNMYEMVYAHCRSGARSAQACERLAAAGVQNAVNVEGGMQAWEAAGFEIEKV